MTKRSAHLATCMVNNQRHVAVLKKDDNLHISFSRGEDCPERILVSTMSLKGDWREWQTSDVAEVLRPETEEEGCNYPVYPSRFGSIHKPVHEVRDPAIYEENGRQYLLYTGAGESNICCAELAEETDSQQPPAH